LETFLKKESSTNGAQPNELIMTYQVLALKSRPQVFSDVLGQEHIVVTLQKAIEKDRLAHAYLFGGPRGVGKTSTARILAKSINCMNPESENPCNKCENCIEITESRSLDVIEIDGASNRGIDEIRNLRETAQYTPMKSKWKIYIIDEVHMLTTPAFNALLKTLEEPPKHVKFIFATTEIHKVLPTILSRCQRYDFRQIPLKTMVEHLGELCKSENTNTSNDALELIAGKSDGSMRDAQSLLDQVIAFSDDEITAQNVASILGIVDLSTYFNLFEIINSKHSDDLIKELNLLVAKGCDVRVLLSGWIEFLHNQLHVKITEDYKSLGIRSEIGEQYLKSANYWNEKDLLRMIQLSLDLQNTIRNSMNPLLMLEVLFLKFVHMDSSVDLGILLSNMKSGKLPVSKPAIKKQKVEPTRQMPAPQQSQIIEKPAAKVEKPKSETTQNDWNGIVEMISKENVSLGLFFEGSKLLREDGKKITISVPAKTDFQKNSIQRRMSEVEDIIQKCFGKKLRLICQYEEVPESTQKKPKVNEENPVVKNILDLFNGEVI